MRKRLEIMNKPELMNFCRVKGLKKKKKPFKVTGAFGIKLKEVMINTILINLSPNECTFEQYFEILKDHNDGLKWICNKAKIKIPFRSKKGRSRKKIDIANDILKAVKKKGICNNTQGINNKETNTKEKKKKMRKNNKKEIREKNTGKKFEERRRAADNKELKAIIGNFRKHKKDKFFKKKKNNNNNNKTQPHR